MAGLRPAIDEETKEIHRRVRDAVGDGARLDGSYITMNGLATVTACYGLLANSTAVVIGAMLLALLLGPISGIALGLVDGNHKLLRVSAISEVVGVVLVLGLGILVGFAHRNIPLTPEILGRTSPNALDLMIALAGGAAMAYALISAKVSAGIVGVAIATALVPPLGVAGICIARGEYGLAGGALLLFLTNLIAIEAANSVVFWAFGFRRSLRTEASKMELIEGKFVSFSLVIALGILLSYNLQQNLEKARFEGYVRDELALEVNKLPGSSLAETVIRREGNSVIVNGVIRSPFSLLPEQVAEMEDRLILTTQENIRLTITAVLVKQTNRDGYLHELEKEAEESNEEPETAPAGEDEQINQAVTEDAAINPAEIPSEPQTGLAEPGTSQSPSPSPGTGAEGSAPESPVEPPSSQ